MPTEKELISRPVGRPTKFEEFVDPAQPGGSKSDQLITLLRAGAKRSSACAYLGVSYDTFRGWLERGKDPEKYPELARFRAEVHDARTSREIPPLTSVQAAADRGDWRAAAFLLRTFYPEKYATPVRAAVAVQGQIEHRHSLVTDDSAEYVRLLEAAAEQDRARSH